MHSLSLDSIKILPEPRNQYSDCLIRWVNGQLGEEKNNVILKFPSDVPYCKPELNFLGFFE